ncbi:endo-beta-1,4-glucanase [Flagelloscypha sp. PMI_526]|nr:endo-beta-1,4-glucanase [Flagelloscypha sp. PMI_526]
MWTTSILVLHCFATLVLAGGSGGKNRTLNQLAVQQGLHYFGSASDNLSGSWDDEPYVDILLKSHEFGQITPANAMKWGLVETQRGVYNYTGGDQLVKAGKKAGMVVRGHALVWHSQLPDYVGTITDAATLHSVTFAHIKDEVKHFKGELIAWDVVNEVFEDTGGMRETIFYNLLGEGYIAEAFRAAHAIDKHAKLYLNDYNLEFADAKWETAVSFVQGLVDSGVPIHAVGFQGHLLVGQVPTVETLVKALSAFTDMGLEVAFTEVDIRMEMPFTDDKLAQQAKDYQTVVEACLAVPKCVGITVWDFSDKYSWIPGVFPTQGAALPWDENMQKKPAYGGIVAGLT